MICCNCKSTSVHKDGNHNGFQRYRCLNCGKRFDGDKYEKEAGMVIHFNTRLKKTDRNQLTRENYCIPKKELDYRDKKNIRMAKQSMEMNGRPPLLCPTYYYDIPNEVFEDEEHYTNEFVEKHYKDCMENFDLNMLYFERLDYEDFNKYITKIVKNKKFLEISDLSQVKGKIGAYILVLDNYKQAYIGISTTDIKKRILQHWSNRKEFGRLLNGSAETSIISIDSFGALDTTRIFYKELKWYQDLDEYEEKLVNEFKPEYRLNRVSGGLNAEECSTIRNLRLMLSTNKRQLK